ncbi:MAG: malate dehydrogenase [Candidatus Margulisiibacteriota bacterium]
MKPKVSIIGAGNVGSQCAYRLAQLEIAEIILLDILQGLPQGKALDMCQAAAVDKFEPLILGTNNYEDTKNSSVVVITAGLARKPGMSREDLIVKNAEIVKEVVEKVIKFSPNAVLLVVTNPLDIMTYYAYQISGFPANRVLGMAPVLDAARMAYFISQALKVSIKEIYAEVLGSHGDLMVPIPRLSSVQGKPITELLTVEQIAQIVKKTKEGGAEIVNLLKTGSAYYAPGSSAAKMVEAIIKDQKEVMGTCCYLNGPYGLNNVYLGVPAKLGKNGVEEIIEIELTSEEKSALLKAAESVKSFYPILKI